MKRLLDRRLLAALGGYAVFKFVVADSRAYDSNCFLDSKQIQELELRNYTLDRNQIIYGHTCNSMKLKKEREKVVIVGAGLEGMTQAIKMLQKGFNVVVLDQGAQESQLLNSFGCLIDVPQFPRVFGLSSIFQMLRNAIFSSDDFNRRLNLNAFFDRSIIYFLLNLALSEPSSQRGQAIEEQRSLLHESSHKELKSLEGLNLIDDWKNSLGSVMFFDSATRRDQGLAYLLEKQGQPQSFNNAGGLIKVTHTDSLGFADEHLTKDYQFGLAAHYELIFNGTKLRSSIMHHILNEYKNSVQFINGCRADHFLLNRRTNQVCGVVTNQGIILGEHFILVAGVETRYLASKLKLRLPILAAKGWALRVNSPLKDFGLTKTCIYKTPDFVIQGEAGEVRATRGFEICHYSPTSTYMDFQQNEKLMESFAKQTGVDLANRPYKVDEFYRALTPNDATIIGKVPDFENVIVSVVPGTQESGLCLRAAAAVGEIIQSNLVRSEFDLRKQYYV